TIGVLGELKSSISIAVSAYILSVAMFSLLLLSGVLTNEASVFSFSTTEFLNSNPPY
ncbi:9097_t:CDS:1, partial [Scutellospora calospora]